MSMPPAATRPAPILFLRALARYHRGMQDGGYRLPGGDLIETGLADRRRGLVSIVSVARLNGAPRLAQLGVEVPDPIPFAERRPVSMTCYMPTIRTPHTADTTR